MYNNDVRVANTATLPFGTVPNVGQYGWTKTDTANYNQLIEYVDMVKQLYQDFLDKMQFVDDTISKFQGLDEIIEYVTLKANEVAEDARQVSATAVFVRTSFNSITTMHDNIVVKYEDFIPKYNNFTIQYEDTVVKYDSVVAMHTEILQIAEELRNGQVYRGTWNPMTQAAGTMPDAEGKNSTWDVILNDGTVEFDFGGFKWRSGDRLVYIVAGNKYDRVATGAGVASINGEVGAVILTPKKLGAVGYTDVIATTDIDNVIERGEYNVVGGNPNWPYKGDGGNMTVHVHVDGKFLTQIAYSGRSPQIKTRSLSDGTTWSKWVQIYTEEYTPNPSDIGAIAAMNGTATGTLMLAATNTKKMTIESDDKYLATQENHLVIGNQTAGGMIVISSNLPPAVAVGGQTGIIYSALNKPTPSELGAVEITDVETTGDEIMRKNGPRDIQIQEALASATGGAFIGETAPPNPFLGARWYDTNDGRTYIWYEDPDSSQWVEENPQSADVTATSEILAKLASDRRLDVSVKMDGDNAIYHEGNKPMPGDIGALDANLGGAIKGGISISVPSTTTNNNNPIDLLLNPRPLGANAIGVMGWDSTGVKREYGTGTFYVDGKPLYTFLGMGDTPWTQLQVYSQDDIRIGDNRIFHTNNRPRPGNIEKHYIYLEDWHSLTIGPNVTQTMLPTILISNNGITFEGNSVCRINRTGVYRLRYSYQLEPIGGNQQTVSKISGVQAGTTGFITGSYQYMPGTTAVTMATSEYQLVRQMNAGDAIQLHVEAVNSTTAKIWGKGYMSIEEIY